MKGRLKVGTRVWWDDPDDGICSGAGVVTEVSGDVVSLQMDDGGEVEALRREVSEA